MDKDESYLIKFNNLIKTLLLGIDEKTIDNIIKLFAVYMSSIKGYKYSPLLFNDKLPYFKKYLGQIVKTFNYTVDYFKKPEMVAKYLNKHCLINNCIYIFVEDTKSIPQIVNIIKNILPNKLSIKVYNTLHPSSSSTITLSNIIDRLDNLERIDEVKIDEKQ